MNLRPKNRLAGLRPGNKAIQGDPMGAIDLAADRQGFLKGGGKVEPAPHEPEARGPG